MIDRNDIKLADELDEFVELLLGFDTVDVNSKNNSGETPLSKAAQQGNCRIVERLIKTRKVNVDSKDHTGQTPLSKAVKECDMYRENKAYEAYKAIVIVLLETGDVDVCATDNYGQTPLSSAEQSGLEEIVQMLRQAARKTPSNAAETGSSDLPTDIFLD